MGGALATLVFAFVSTWAYTTLEAGDTKYLMACPVVSGMGWSVHRCDVEQQAGGLFALHPLAHWRVLRALLPAAVADGVWASEMQFHAVALAVFASLVAPFGGFFASGFKRAFKIKDFGTSIPGHGGFTDRMDCQLVMGAFAYVYCSYVLRLTVGPGGADVVAHYASLLAARLAERDLRALHARLGEYLDGLQHAVGAPPPAALAA